MKKLRTTLFPPHRPLRWILPLAVLVGLVLLQTLLPQWAGRPEAWTVDARFLLRGPEAPRFPIVIVAADEDSFQMLGGLEGENIRTWPRERWAELVSRIAAGEPRAIVLDAVFDTPGWDEGGDAALAAALAATGNGILAANLQQQGAPGSELLTYSPPIETLSQAAWGVGVATFASDADGAIRRVPLLYPWGGKGYPSLALATAVLYSGNALDMPGTELADDLTVPIHFRGPEKTFATVPLYQVMDGEVDPQTFHGAIVLVGYTTQLEQDRHAAPFAGRQRMPGVEIQANAVDTLLAGDWLHRGTAALVPQLIVLLGLVALAALNMRRPGLGIAATLGALLLYLLAAVLVFAWADFILPVIAPAAGALGVGGVALVERLAWAEREKRQMRQRFASVMSAERLRAVMEHWDDLLRPERRLKEAAVLFADIRGFTHATETLMAQERTGEMVSFLTAYLDAMAAAVFAEGGVIYRMLGDGLLILFGLPDPLPNHALSAVRGALRMAHAAEQLAALWPLRDEAGFGMGIGVNAGRMTDGIVGSGRQLDYTVIGDAVNTAARIESHCKVAMDIPRPAGGTVPGQVTILLGADLYAQVRDLVLADESLPPFPAHGKAGPLHVVRLLGLRDGRL